MRETLGELSPRSVIRKRTCASTVGGRQREQCEIALFAARGAGVPRSRARFRRAATGRFPGGRTTAILLGWRHSIRTRRSKRWLDGQSRATGTSVISQCRCGIRAGPEPEIAVQVKGDGQAEESSSRAGGGARRNICAAEKRVSTSAKSAARSRQHVPPSSPKPTRLRSSRPVAAAAPTLHVARAGRRRNRGEDHKKGHRFSRRNSRGALESRVTPHTEGYAGTRAPWTARTIR